MTVELGWDFLAFEAPKEYILEDENVDFQHEFQFDFNNNYSGYVGEELDLFKDLLNEEDIDSNQRDYPQLTENNAESINLVVSQKGSQTTGKKSKNIKINANKNRMFTPFLGKIIDIWIH